MLITCTCINLVFCVIPRSYLRHTHQCKRQIMYNLQISCGENAWSSSPICSSAVQGASCDGRNERLSDRESMYRMNELLQMPASAQSHMYHQTSCTHARRNDVDERQVQPTPTYVGLVTPLPVMNTSPTPFGQTVQLSSPYPYAQFWTRN